MQWTVAPFRPSMMVSTYGLLAVHPVLDNSVFSEVDDVMVISHVPSGLVVLNCSKKHVFRLAERLMETASEELKALGEKPAMGQKGTPLAAKVAAARAWVLAQEGK